MKTTERLLILTKTYPHPSSNYREHTCVVAMNEAGELRRLYPVPFRLLEREKQFRKWQWITADIIKAVSDRRPESFRIDVDSIQLGAFIPTTGNWSQRSSLIEPHILPGFSALEQQRIATRRSLGFIKPSNYRLEIEEEKEKQWTRRELDHLTKEGLFDSDTVKHRPVLRKIPYKFNYAYESEDNGVITHHRHMITDWEVSMLYLICVQKYGGCWEEKFREKLETNFIKNHDLLMLLGTVHRFPDEWLIVGLVYPKKAMGVQGLLFRKDTNG